MFALLTSCNQPYRSAPLNRQSLLSYLAGIIYLLYRLALRSLEPTDTTLVAVDDTCGLVSQAPLDKELLAATGVFYDKERNHDIVWIGEWSFLGSIVAIEAYFVWRLYLSMIGAFSRTTRCKCCVRLFTCCLCSSQDFGHVIYKESGGPFDEKDAVKEDVVEEKKEEEPSVVELKDITLHVPADQKAEVEKVDESVDKNLNSSSR